VADAKAMVARVINILIAPNTEWRVIAAESAIAGDIFYHYVLVLAAVPPICALIGFSLFGRISFGVGLLAMIVQYMLALGAVFFVVVVAQYLSPKYAGRDDFIQAAKLVVYSHTASWVGGVFLLIPPLAFVSIAFAVYGLYLLYAGCSAVMAVPPEHAEGYAVAVVATVVITYGAISIIMGLVFDLGMLGLIM
jgi:Yip1 domain